MATIKHLKSTIQRCRARAADPARTEGERQEWLGLIRFYEQSIERQRQQRQRQRQQRQRQLRRQSPD